MDIKFYLVFLMIIKTIKSNLDPTLAMCIDGEIDTAVITKDGSTYIFMDQWYWKLSDDLGSVIGNWSKISNDWPNLPNRLDTAFHLSSHNLLEGKTIFIKNNNWYAYDNKAFVDRGDTSIWNEFPTHVMLAIAEHNDPIVMFFEKSDSNVKVHYPFAFYFDSLYYPERKDMIKYSQPFDVKRTKAVLSYSNDMLLVFSDDKFIGKHCFMAKSDRNCKKKRMNRDLFVCPNETKDIFSKNALSSVWFWTGLKFTQFACLILALLLSITFILIFLLLILGLQLKNNIENKYFSKKRNFFTISS